MPMPSGCVVYDYSPAVDGIRLDANESPWGEDGLNRYPAQDPAALRAAMAAYYDVPADWVLPTRGSDDAIDALGRTLLEPNRDAVMITPPTFAMFAEFARWQRAAVVEVPLRDGLHFDVDAMLRACDERVRIVWVCAPNNPTGSVLPQAALEYLCENLPAHTTVVVDEAYQEFSRYPSAIPLLQRFRNLAVLRTLSKAFGLAGLRVGALIAPAPFLQRVRAYLPPYLLPTPVVERALAAFTPERLARMSARAAELRARRDRFATTIAGAPGVGMVFVGEANSVYLRAPDPAALSARLRARGVHVRAFADSVRISIGTEEEMTHAQAALLGS